MPALARTAAVTALLALPLGLAACGGDSGGSGGGSSSSSSSSTSSSSAASSTTSSPSSSAAAPSTSSSTTSASPSTTSSPSTSSSSAVAGKPTKDAVINGYVKGLSTDSRAKKIPPATLRKVATCAIDASYSKMHLTSLKAIASANPNARLDPKDNAVFAAANVACGKKYGTRK